MTWDAVIVGARCAGASTAMLLARRGLRVLVLDKARPGSDTLSTLFIQPAGAALLRAWGLAPAIQATGVPAIGRVSWDFGVTTIAGFAVLHAGAHLPRHRGPGKSLRYHLGLRVPEPPGSCRIEIGDGGHAWAEGVSLVFDDAVDHEAWNDTDQDRYVLFLEVLWPLPPGLALVNKAAQLFLRLGARDVPGRAAELDAALNPPRG